MDGQKKNSLPREFELVCSVYDQWKTTNRICSAAAILLSSPKSFFLFYFFFFIVAVVQFILLTFRVRAVCLQIHLEPADTGQVRGDAVADGARSENNWIWFPSLCNVLLCIPYYVLIIKIE